MDEKQRQKTHKNRFCSVKTTTIHKKKTPLATNDTCVCCKCCTCTFFSYLLVVVGSPVAYEIITSLMLEKNVTFFWLLLRCCQFLSPFWTTKCLVFDNFTAHTHTNTHTDTFLFFKRFISVSQKWNVVLVAYKLENTRHLVEENGLNFISVVFVRLLYDTWRDKMDVVVLFCVVGFRNEWVICVYVSLCPFCYDSVQIAVE